MSGSTISSSSMISFHDSNPDDIHVSIQLNDVEETWLCGEWIGSFLLDLWDTPTAQCPPIIAAEGDLGSGKTSLAQGIARGLGVPPNTYVNSPTFSILQTHQGQIPFHHIDLYRLYDEEELTFLGLDEIIQDGIAYIEWPQRAPLFFQQAHLKFHLSYPPNDVSYRLLSCRLHALPATESQFILRALYDMLSGRFANQATSQSQESEH